MCKNIDAALYQLIQLKTFFRNRVGLVGVSRVDDGTAFLTSTTAQWGGAHVFERHELQQQYFQLGRQQRDYNGKHVSARRGACVPTKPKGPVAPINGNPLDISGRGVDE